MGAIVGPHECPGQHHFFVAETGTVESLEGSKVSIVIVCTQCGDSKLIEHRLSGNIAIHKKDK